MIRSTLSVTKHTPRARALVAAEHPRGAEVGADLEHPVARAHRQVAAEEHRARLGRLHPVGHREDAAVVDEEQHARVGSHLPITRRK